MTPFRRRANQSQKPATSAYSTALSMVARRELSEAQVRERLRRKGFEDDDIDAAIARLKESRAIDDERVAEAIAHTAVSVQRRGKLRTRRQIERAGISAATAKRAIDATYGDLDQDALIEASLARRLRGGQRITDRAHFQRLFRYLVGQGFGTDLVLATLRRRSSAPEPEA